MSEPDIDAHAQSVETTVFDWIPLLVRIVVRFVPGAIRLSIDLVCNRERIYKPIDLELQRCFSPPTDRGV
jgi:hypothetical protein